MVIDEASQVCTGDLAALVALARRTGARLVLVGDTAQLGAVEAGGMMRLIGSDLGHWELAEVHRFDAEWEALASLQLRQGARAALRAYDARGRIRGAHQAEAERDAVALYLADHLMGRDSLLLAGTNEEAAKLAGMVRAELARLGRVPQRRRSRWRTATGPRVVTSCGPGRTPARWTRPDAGSPTGTRSAWRAWSRRQAGPLRSRGASSRTGPGPVTSPSRWTTSSARPSWPMRATST